MLPAFIENDVYRVMLGSESCERLLARLQFFLPQPAGEIRRLRRDDGTRVYVATQYVDGADLEQLLLRGELLLMQIDNISARLRATPSLSDGAGRAQRHFGYAA